MAEAKLMLLKPGQGLHIFKDWVRENGYHDLETLRELVGMGEISEDEIDSLYDEFEEWCGNNGYIPQYC